MKSSTLGTRVGRVMVMVIAIAAAPLACLDSSSSNGPASPDGGGAGIDAGGAVLPDGGTGDAGPIPTGCPAPTRGPTTHGGGSTSDPANDVWTADGSPHILPYDTTIYKTVTVEPCAEVLIAAGKQITVRGSLVAEGTATRPIHIGAKDAGQPFASFRTVSPATIRLAYTTIDGGGAPLNTLPYLTGTLDLSGDTLKPVQETLFVDHVTIAGSASNGLVMKENAGFIAGSSALVVTGAAVHPLSSWSRSVGGIPAGAYTGNGNDTILLPTGNTDTISETTTLHDRGVPYLVGSPQSAGDLRVDVAQGPPGVTLTIEAGVTMRFKKGGVLRVAVASSTSPARGSLIAAGTAAMPIVFTSDEASPAAGDWLGIWYGEVPTALDTLDHVRVEYAGGTSTSGSGSCPDNSELNNDAAIRIFGPPASEFITNTSIVASPTNGIDRGWRADTPVIDFLATNTFTGVALCKQTYPPTASNVCPVPVPCP
jgi:hypothetical protein